MAPHRSCLSIANPARGLQKAEVVLFESQHVSQHHQRTPQEQPVAVAAATSGGNNENDDVIGVEKSLPRM